MRWICEWNPRNNYIKRELFSFVIVYLITIRFVIYETGGKSSLRALCCLGLLGPQRMGYFFFILCYGVLSPLPV